MNINFINKSGKDIYITLSSENLTINSGERKSVVAEQSGTIGVQVNEGSYVTYIMEKFGIVLKRYFKVKSEYSYNSSEDMTIILTSDKKKGKFMDEYERVICLADNSLLSLLTYSVPDEEKLKKELGNAVKRGDNTLKLFDLFDILGNGLSAALFLLIPFVIIWIIADVELAGKICLMAFIPIFAVIICLNRFFDKLKRNLWKSARSAKLKNQIFKDYNSYFDNEYIASVLK
jgi:hypothetical protein